MTKTLVNTITNETWLCDNFDDVRIIECQEFVSVYRKDRPSKVLMNKDSLTEVITNEMQYQSGMQLNG